MPPQAGPPLAIASGNLEMSTDPRRGVELNEPSHPGPKAAELRQHLINASNELYLYTLKCEGQGGVVPPALKRAHTSIRAELRRLEAELGIEP